MRGYFIHPFDDDRFIAGNAHGCDSKSSKILPDVDAIVASGRRRRPAGRRRRGRCARSTRRPPSTPRNPRRRRRSARRWPPAGRSTSSNWRASFVDGAGGKSVLETMWPLLRGVDGSIVVSLDDVARAITATAERAHVIAEGAAGCAVAAALSGRAGARQGRRHRLRRQHRSGSTRLRPRLVDETPPEFQRFHRHMSRYASLPPRPPRIARLDELAIDLWWSWHEARAVFRRLDYAALAERRRTTRCGCCGRFRRRRLEAAAADPEFLALYDRAVDGARRARGRRETPGGRDTAPHLAGRVGGVLLRRVRAPPVAADLRRRSRRARRRSLQGSRRPRRAARRRRVHVPAGLLPPAPVGRRLAGRKLRAPELDRRADRRGDAAGRQAVHHRGAARRPIGARRRLARAVSAASRSTCSIPISKRTRRGIASCRRGCTAAIARRVSSRKSSSASAACARSRRSASTRAPFISTKATPPSSCCSASANYVERGRSFDDALEEIRRDDDLHDPHAGAGRPRRVPVSSGRKASGRLLGHAWAASRSSFSRSARTTAAAACSST